MRRAQLAAFLAAAMLAVPSTPAGAKTPPHIDDETTDANFLNGQGTTDLPAQRTNPGSQRYADVDTVLFEGFYLRKPVGRRLVRVPFAFLTTMTLAADPVPAANTANVFHVWGTSTCGPNARVGLVYRTNPFTGRGAQPEFALRDTCTGVPRETRVLGDITGEVVTWAVPMEWLPKEFKSRISMTNLRFEVREAVPAQACRPELPNCDLGYGIIDEGKGSRPFIFG